MIRKIDPDNRRILNFPAVRPCESISPSILVTSLISLSKEIINLKSKLYPSQKRIIREVIRQVEILHIFFEEIRDDNLPNFPKSLILSLSELHFALQKIHFLLKDCTREGCSLYILMKSEFIVSNFKVLINSIGSSLDVVDVESLEISTEVKEVVGLLAKQAQKSKLEVHLYDQCVMERVMLVLNQFEDEFEPERGLIKRVLDYLGIFSWGDCNKEVKFLEEELSNIEEEEEEEKEVDLISSLLGFMCYCRGVIFETLDEQIIDQSEAKSEVISCLNPEDFRCPISLELMMDPVTISTGQTYDRGSIQKWLKSGHLLCPKTGEKLETSEVVPNSALKKLIHQFCSDNGISMSKSGRRTKELSKMVVVPPSLASREAMRFLAQFLAARLTYGTDEQKNKAAYEIRLLTKSSIFNREILIEMGNVPVLLDLLTSIVADTQENAIAAVLKLAKHSKGQKAIIEEGGLMLIISVLRRGLKIESRQIAAATIFYLSAVEKYRRLIGSTREAIPGLIDLIKEGTMCGKKNALAAIFGLLLYHRNHEKVLEAGIVPELIDVMSSIERSDLLADCLAVLACLSEKADGSVAMLQTSALSLIMSLMKSSISKAGKEYCVSILASLSVNGGNDVVAVLAKEPAIMPSLYALVTDGSAHASKKARALINMLQKFQESSSSSSSSSLAAASKFHKERFAHAVQLE